MNEVSYKEIQKNEEGQRLDNYLIRILKGVPKSHIYRIIRAGEVRVNKKRAQVATRLCEGDLVRIPPVRLAAASEVRVGSQLAQQLQSSILFEDNGLLVINKPAGLAVHGGSGLSLGVIEALRKMRTDLPYLELAHRLDKETSGCLLLAKKRSVLRSIQALLEARAIKKTYWALLLNAWKGKKEITIDLALQKNTLKSGERLVQVNAEDGKASKTQIKLLENYSQACWVEARPETGRTHQIRVHCAHQNHPILGDDKYGGKLNQLAWPKPMHRLYLHARAIQFTLNGHPFVFQADLDTRFTKAIELLQMNKEND